MNNYYSIFNKFSGEILRVVKCSDSSINLQVAIQEDFIEGLSNDSIHYINDVNSPNIANKPGNGSLIDKDLVIANGVDKIVLSGTPVGAIVTLGDITITSNGEDIDLTFDIAGKYPLKVELFPHLPFEAEIDAT